MSPTVPILHQRLSAVPRPDEADVLEQVEAVSSALRSLSLNPEPIGCTLDLRSLHARLEDVSPRVAFNLVESLEDHGRLAHLVPMALEAWRIPFTGSGGQAMYTATGKLLSKQLMRAAGIPTPPWRTRSGLAKGETVDSGRWIIKSVWEHASLGLDEDSVIEVDETAGARERLTAELERRLPSLGHEGFVERYVEGREFNMSVLAGRVLRPVEMCFEGYAPGRPRVVGYRAKWDPSASEYHATVRRFDFPAGDAPLLGELERLSRLAWDTFQLRGWARVDFRVSEDGKPMVLEVNANPCLSPDAGFAAAVARSGLTYADAIDAILRDVAP